MFLIANWKQSTAAIIARIAPRTGGLSFLGQDAVFAAAAALIVGLGAVPEFLNLLHRDNAWYLQAGGKLLDGVAPYVDQFIEMNPPLIMWLNAIPAAVARALDLSPILVFRLSVGALALTSVALCHRLLTRLLSREHRVWVRYITLLLLFALFPLTHDDFGQREHLLFALVVPYVLLAVCRAEDKAVARWAAVLIGVLAGLGMALKPFFFVFLLSLEGWLFLRARLRVPRWRPENLAVLATALTYLLAVIVWTPEYFALVRLLGAWQRTYHHKSLLQLTLLRGETWLTLGVGLAFFVLRRALWLRSLWTALLIATAGCLLSAVLQGKGFGYHYYPALAFGVVLLGGLAADSRARLSTPTRRMAATAAAAGAFTLAVSTVAASLSRIPEGLNWRRTEMGRVIAFVEAHAVDHRVFLLNSGLRESVVAAYAGVEPMSRLMHVGLLDAAYRDAIRSEQPLRYREPEEMGPVERYALRTVVKDFERGHPLLLLVRGPGPDRPDDPTPVMFDRWGRFDYISYFSRDSAFARLFRHYTFAGTVGHYHAYRPLRPGETRAPPPPRPDAGVLARTTERGGFGLWLGPRNRSLLLFLISLCLLVLKDWWARPPKLSPTST